MNDEIPIGKTTPVEWLQRPMNSAVASKGRAMPIEVSDRPPFRIEIPTVGAAFCIVIGLAAALEFAIEATIFIDRAEIDNEPVDIRIEAFAEQFVREAKNVPTELISESDETAGIATAVAMINGVRVSR